MGIYNLGMLLGGLPDPNARQQSTILNDLTAQNAAYMQDWQRRYDAAVPVWRTSNSSGDWVPDGTPTAQQSFLMANGADPEAAGAAGHYTGGGSRTYYDTSGRDALNRELAQRNKTMGAELSAYQTAQQANQNAYNQAGGGSFLGGQINGSYAAPQTGLDPSSPINGMLNLQPWSMPGFGGPTGGASQASFGSPATNTAQPQGWGGPFTARNPWAAS